MALRSVDILVRMRDRASAGFKGIGSAARGLRRRLSGQGAGIKNDFESFGGSMQRSMVGAIAKVWLLVQAFKALKAVTVDYVRAGVSGNAQMEQFQVTMATNTRDLGKAQEMLAEATKFAAETPFEIPEVVEATVRLETYGLKAQEVLRVVGDMAAVTGKPLMQAIEAMADAQTGELERLKEFGITKAQLIEAGAKVNSRGAIEDMNSLNDALLEIMNDRFGGGMRLMTQTFTGIVSNLTDAWGTFQRAVGKPTFEVVKSGLKDLLGIVNQMSEDGTLDVWAERIGQSIAKVVKFIMALPKLFSLVGRSFVEFLRSLSNWEFVTKSLGAVATFIVESFTAVMRALMQLVVSTAKVIWLPLLRSFFEVFVVGIKNLSDEVTTILKGIFTGDLFDESSRRQLFRELETRLVERLDSIGGVWDSTWDKAGANFANEMQNVKNVAGSSFMEINRSFNENIVPMVKEGIGSELTKEWKEYADTINSEVIPSQLEFNLEQQKTIGTGRDIIEQDKKALKEAQKNRREKEQMERELTERLIGLSLGEEAAQIARLQRERNAFIQAGVDRQLVEQVYNLEVQKLNEQRVQETARVSSEIDQLTLESTDFRLQQIEREKQALLQKGIDSVEVEQWASLRRLQVTQEADREIRREGLFTIQALTSHWGTFLGFIVRGFRIFRGISNETWQELIANVIEWGTGLVAQYLIARGLELLRRAEGKKTHADFMRNHGEEMIALSAKLALQGDLVRAGIAAGLGTASLIRAAALDKEAKSMERTAKASIGLGIAVQTGGVIAGEALREWGERADDARRKQAELNREAEKVGVEPSGMRGLPASQGFDMSGSGAPVPVEVVRTSIPAEPTPIASPAIAAAPALEVSPASANQPSVTFVQNNNFEGLVNFENDEALRELARQLQPFLDEFTETFTAVA